MHTSGFFTLPAFPCAIYKYLCTHYQMVAMEFMRLSQAEPSVYILVSMGFVPLFHVGVEMLDCGAVMLRIYLIFQSKLCVRHPLPHPKFGRTNLASSEGCVGANGITHLFWSILTICVSSCMSICTNLSLFWIQLQCYRLCSHIVRRLFLFLAISKE